jgi:hypothetical protein
MVRILLSLVAAVLLALSSASSIFADELKGEITKVGGGGREITVKGKDKEVTVKVSASRTALEGVGDRSELKVGQSVTVDYSGDDAKKISVRKGK